MIQEAQWGRFEHDAAPLDEPPLDSGPMSPEMQQKVFDILVDSGSDPKELKATGNYPDVESLDSDVARRMFQRMMGETKMKIAETEIRRIIKEELDSFLNEGAALTPEQVVAQITRIPRRSMWSGAMMDWEYIAEGDDPEDFMLSAYPGVNDWLQFARDVVMAWNNDPDASSAFTLETPWLRR